MATTTRNNRKRTYESSLSQMDARRGAGTMEGKIAAERPRLAFLPEKIFSDLKLLPRSVYRGHDGRECQPRGAAASGLSGSFETPLNPF